MKILFILLAILFAKDSFAFDSSYKKQSSSNKEDKKREALDKKIASGEARDYDYIARGKKYIEEGKPLLAIKDFSKAIELNNLSIENYISRAEVEFELGNTFDASQDLHEIFNSAIVDVNKGPFYKDFWKRAYLLRAKINEKNGNQTSAEADYKKAEDF